MQVRAVFFDVGYTLFDETRLWREWADWLRVDPPRLFQALRVAIERDEPHLSALSSLSPGFDLKAARRARLQEGRPDGFITSDLYPDVRPRLQVLKAAGIITGAAGNTSMATEAMLGKIGLPLDVNASSARWSASKPAAGFFEHLVDAAGVPPAAVAYVGDRLDHDIVPAARAGLRAVFLRRGPWAEVHRARPEGAAASAVIDSLVQLPPAIGLTAP